MSITRAVSLLRDLVAVPSPSRGEEGTAAVLLRWLEQYVPGAQLHRVHNNVVAVAPGFDPAKPTLLLNSHHDTVPPCTGWTRDPYELTIEGDRLYGLGANDAGGCLVTLACTFADLYRTPLPVNLVLGLTAEEEVTGANGMRALLPWLAANGLTPVMAIVGEPTGMDCAVAERGLVVLDGLTLGRAGHAARNEGVNALYLALDDIDALRSYRFETESSTLGPIGVNVTCINAGTRHNVVPDRCEYTVDVRTTDAYTNAETVELLRRVAVNSTLTPRSTHINASVIDPGHPLVRSAVTIGRDTFVSPTLSDCCVLSPIPAIKIGPGQSSRSHTADEYVTVPELAEALELYSKILLNLKP